MRTPRTLESLSTKLDVEIPGTGVSMPGFAAPREGSPPKRPFVFPKEQTEDIAIATRLAMNVCLTGPTGCGKTSLPLAIAGELNQPIMRFNLDGETRVPNLRGMHRPAAKDGVLTLEFSYGDLAVAMKNGWWVLLDEIDAALPSVLFVLQPVLEEGNRSLRIPETGEVVHAHPDFRLFATANTVGYRAQARSRHAGANPMNAAFVDRFGMLIAADYPTKDEEVKRVLANVPECDPDFVEVICRIAERLRTDAKFVSDFSTRRCVQWARLTVEYDYSLMRAAELSVIRKMESPLDAKITREVIQRFVGSNEGKS